MMSTLCHDNSIVHDLVDQAMFRGDTSGIVAAEVLFKALRFTKTLFVIRVAMYVFEKGSDAFKNLFVILLPVKIIFPSVSGKIDDQSSSSFVKNWLASISSTASSRRSLFVLEESR